MDDMQRMMMVNALRGQPGMQSNPMQGLQQMLGQGMQPGMQPGMQQGLNPNTQMAYRMTGVPGAY